MRSWLRLQGGSTARFRPSRQPGATMASKFWGGEESSDDEEEVEETESESDSDSSSDSDDDAKKGPSKCVH